MKIGRMETGISTGKRKLVDYFEFSYIKGMCGCHIFSLFIFYFTWMGDECYFNPPENEEPNE